MRICSIEGCGSKHYGNGYCKKHHARIERNGHLDLLIGEENKIYKWMGYTVNQDTIQATLF